MILSLRLSYPVTDALPEGKFRVLRQKEALSPNTPHLSLGGSTAVGRLTHLSTLQQLHNDEKTILL